MNMEELRNTILIASLVFVGLTVPVGAEMATMDEAVTVANNWINLIIQKKGSWGDANAAYVEDIQEFKRVKRVVGYFCRVKPKGYIVVSLRKELAPVKACSSNGYLDPESEEGMADMLKGRMERMLDAIEQQSAPDKSRTDTNTQSTVRIDYRPAWDELSGNIETFKAGLTSGIIAMNYAGGDPPLLSSSWHQGYPYKRDCPYLPSPDSCRPLAGCVAIAGAQVMRYWAWPPNGEGPSPLKGGEPYNDTYDWANMLDRYVWENDRWEDENGNPCSQAQIDAVAELCDEMGDSVKTAYGCDVSNAFITCDFIPICNCSLEDAMKLNFRYSMNLDVEFSHDVGSDAWFEIIKGQLNLNRPLPYSCLVPGLHVIVVDGWRVLSGPIKQFHMNYGWGGGVPNPTDPNTHPDWLSYTTSNTWYTLDALPGSDSFVETVLVEVKPAPSLGSTLTFGTYARPPYPYRYFDQDCASIISSTFAAGQNLQFLPGVKLRCISPSPGDRIRFGGTISENTRLYSIKGTQSAGIKIGNGAIELYAGGGLRFH
jgi:hypothetical protein